MKKLKRKSHQNKSPQAQHGDLAWDSENIWASTFCFCLVRPCAGPFTSLWLSFSTYQMRRLDSISFRTDSEIVASLGKTRSVRLQRLFRTPQGLQQRERIDEEKANEKKLSGVSTIPTRTLITLVQPCFYIIYTMCFCVRLQLERKRDSMDLERF